MAHFRIRYARYNGRFKACTMLDHIEYCKEEAVAFPQNIGRLESLLSHGKLEQNEDAFFLDIWSSTSENLKPVIFWIHGGAFVAGGSSDNQNDASKLAENADCIVVSVTYRIGFLGTSYFETIPQTNCGFHDIITALEWTNKNIAQFGGDKNNITIAGQSSGAWYAMAIHTSPLLQHLFQKTMLFSWPGTMKAITQKTSQSISNEFFQKIKNIETENLEKILRIQKIVGKRNRKKRKFDVPLLPTIEKGYISDDFFRDVKKIDKKIFLQYTKDECGAYLYHYPISKNTSPLLVSFFLRRYCPEKTYKKLLELRKQTKDTYQATLALASEYVFHKPANKIAEISGNNAVIHEFNFPTKNERTKCCHCFDLPFIFGCINNWENSKLFEGCNREDMQRESLKMQEIIKNFIY